MTERMNARHEQLGAGTNPELAQHLWSIEGSLLCVTGQLIDAGDTSIAVTLPTPQDPFYVLSWDLYPISRTRDYVDSLPSKGRDLNWFTSRQVCIGVVDGKIQVGPNRYQTMPRDPEELHRIMDRNEKLGGNDRYTQWDTADGVQAALAQGNISLAQLLVAMRGTRFTPDYRYGSGEGARAKAQDY